ncbi:MAG: hypothetical protein FWE74_10170 [Oscillospiraceae bacterium]|nr:hypothetical protein [Oscillospiraceae bacterium]
MIKEGYKIKLKTGEIALISEVLAENKAYIAEVFNKNGEVSIEQILQQEIASVFVETEHQLGKAM